MSISHINWSNIQNTLGHYTVHVNNILNKWHTKNQEISTYADDNDLVVISKDADFRNSHFLKNSPKKLIKINLGNIPNQELINIFTKNINAFDAFGKRQSFLIEIDKELITINI